MPLKSPEEYLESLCDSREVWFRGERVEDVMAHPVTGLAARHAATESDSRRGS